MINAETRAQIINLINKEVVPAVGCTEPMAVALCAAKAAEVLGCRPQKVRAQLSANILKNAMGVGIPNTGMVGLPIAIALGALVGKSDYGLEVLRDVDTAAVEEGKKFIAEERIHIDLAQNACDKLYVEICVTAGGHSATAAIAHEHTRFTLLKTDRTILLDEQNQQQGNNEVKKEKSGLSLKKVYEFATTTPLEEIRFIDEARQLNEKAAQLSLKGNYGHRLGKILSRPIGRGIMGDSIFSHIISSTSCACDARMAGAMIPVMSNSGSGNQGICATNPIVVFARENNNTEEEMIRALMLSHLTVIYIKEHLGTLSALCGCVVAATGSSCGITYLMGGNYQQITYAVQNMIANLTGMICDGAKPSCAMKLTTGVSTAVMCAMLAMQNEYVTSVEGIIDDDVEQSIRNLVSIGADAMDETDRCVLNIMTHKK